MELAEISNSPAFLHRNRAIHNVTVVGDIHIQAKWSLLAAYILHTRH